MPVYSGAGSHQSRYPCRLCSTRGNALVHNYGAKAGAQLEDILEIIKSESALIDPYSNEEIEITKPYTYYARLVYIDDNYSIAEIIDSNDYGISALKDRIIKIYSMDDDLYTADSPDIFS